MEKKLYLSKNFVKNHLRNLVVWDNCVNKYTTYLTLLSSLAPCLCVHYENNFKNKAMSVKYFMDIKAFSIWSFVETVLRFVVSVVLYSEGGMGFYVQKYNLLY